MTEVMVERAVAAPAERVCRSDTGIVGKLFEGSTRKALAQDLDDIAAAAEGATG